MQTSPRSKVAMLNLPGFYHARGCSRKEADVETGRPVTMARDGMVSCPHAHASEAGVEILKAGGSAVDAAIAASAVLSVIYPHMTSVGGDQFWLIWNAERRGARPLRPRPRRTRPPAWAGRVRPAGPRRAPVPRRRPRHAHNARSRGRLVRGARRTRQAPARARSRAGPRPPPPGPCRRP